MNELATQALVIAARELAKPESGGRRLFVMHQTGEADEAETARQYAAAGIPARVCAFESEMGRAFATADVVVSRAGASTCFELALVGKPAFFIPLPSAIRDHQHYNAQAFVEAGGADEGIQDKLTPRALANWIVHKAVNPAALAKKGAAMLAASTPNAAARVADMVERVSGKNKP